MRPNVNRREPVLRKARVRSGHRLLTHASIKQDLGFRQYTTLLDVDRSVAGALPFVAYSLIDQNISFWHADLSSV